MTMPDIGYLGQFISQFGHSWQNLEWGLHCRYRFQGIISVAPFSVHASLGGFEPEQKILSQSFSDEYVFLWKYAMIVDLYKGWPVSRKMRHARLGPTHHHHHHHSNISAMLWLRANPRPLLFLGPPMSVGKSGLGFALTQGIAEILASWWWWWVGPTWVWHNFRETGHPLYKSTILGF